MAEIKYSPSLLVEPAIEMDLPDTEAVEGTIDGVVGIVVDGNSIAAGKFKVGLRGVAGSGVGAARDGDRGGIGVGTPNLIPRRP